ncbi:MAG: hypothetical protein Q8O47_08270 [Candidatus Bathyarchaeota archaeon]|nr:hypothetical protein [Candidatus Bathyarchaeota archaeon]
MDRKKLMVALAVALLLVPVAPLALAANLTVETGSKYYNAGETVKIKGTATANAIVHVGVNATAGSVFTANVTTNSTGAYATAYTLPIAAPIGIYTVIAKSGNSTADTIFMMSSVSTEDMAQQLIDIAEMSRVLAEETIQSIRTQNVTLPPAVNNSITHGIDAIARAKAFLAEGKNVAAAEAAQSAMKHFKNAMSLALRTANVEEDVEEHRRESLQHQVERLTREVERIEVVLGNLVEAGENVTAIQVILNGMKPHLTNATALIGQGNYTAAETEIKAAKDDLRQATQLLKPLYKEVRKGLMEKYKLNLKARIDSAEDDIGKLKDYLNEAGFSAAMARIGNANGFLKRFENRLKDGDDDDAVNDLEDASEELDDGIAEVDTDGYSYGMGQLNKIRAQIQVLQEMADLLTAQGKDATELLNKIQELQATLDQGLSQMQGGNIDDANDTFRGSEQRDHSDEEHGMSGIMSRWAGSKGHGKND